MIRNYFKLAWRNLWKHKMASFINLLGLAVGMTCCMLILLYVKDELSYNKFNKQYEDIYCLNWISKRGAEVTNAAVTPVPVGKMAIEQVPQIKSVARLYQRSGGMQAEQSKVAATSVAKFQEQNVYFSDSALFSVFTIDFLKGNKRDALRQPASIVLTDEMAKKYFGTEDAIGKFLLYDTRTSLQVSAVVKKMPDNSDIQFDFLIPFETLFSVELPDMASFIRNDWTYNPTYTYCLLQHGTNMQAVESSLNTLLYKFGTDRNRELNRIYLQPLSRIHLYASDIGANPSTSSITSIYIFAIIGLLILVIAVVNFINLATAQASTRSREVGMRKVLGAAKKQLVFQFLGEAVLLSFSALLLAFAFAKIALPVLNDLSQKQLVYRALFDPRMLALFLLLFVLTGIAAGAYPALFIARFHPVLSLKGKSGQQDTKNTLRKFLLVTQYSISILLIVGAIIVYQQLHYLRNKPLGFQKEHMVAIPIFGSGANSLGYGVDINMRQRMNTFSNELLKSSRIKAVTAASALPGQFYIPGLVIPEGFTEKDNVIIPWTCVDYNFISSFKIPLLAGRDFEKARGTDHLSAFIINESAVRSFGWKSPQEAIGKKLIRGDEKNGKRGTIIGVVKDHHFNPLNQPLQPLVMDVTVARFSFFAVNIQSDHIPETIDYIREKWNSTFPERVFEYSFLDSDINAMYRSNENLFKIITYFAVIAIVLSCLGLFSLSSFLTLQRAREIGIRKVLGAGVSRILIMLSFDFLKLASLALLISTPLAFYAAQHWLQDYAYRIDIQWWTFAVAGITVLCMTLITVILQSARTAMTNPVRSLRTE